MVMMSMSNQVHHPHWVSTVVPTVHRISVWKTHAEVRLGRVTYGSTTRVRFDPEKINPAVPK